MVFDDNATLDSVTAPRYGLGPYNTSLAASAASSTTSVWSHTESQFSDDTSISSQSSDNESGDNSCAGKATKPMVTMRSRHTAASTGLKSNPRRTSVGVRNAGPPTLVRQSDRKVNFVDSLVDSSTQIVEAIWPLSSVACSNEMGSKAVLPLRTFIQETLRRSRTSYSTLQVALYYLILVKPHVPQQKFSMEQTDTRPVDRSLRCGRRMFLSALILASKYLQDRNYSARAWSKISGLNTQEINQNEVSFLLAVDWKLHISDEVFKRWTEIVLRHMPSSCPPCPEGLSPFVAAQRFEWKQLILGLDPDLLNAAGLVGGSLEARKPRDLSPSFPRSILNLSQPETISLDCTTTSRLKQIPAVMEPSPAVAFTGGRPAPTFSGLPTPRLTPQLGGFCTPAVGATSQWLGRQSGMSMALASHNTPQVTDRCVPAVSSSPSSYCPLRRSSLATSVSTASSPESMVSDTSRSSLSSSASSASSFASATLNAKLGVSSRFRYSRVWSDKCSVKPSVSSVPEIYDDDCASPSRNTYTTSAVKATDTSLGLPLSGQQYDWDASRDDSEAARTLQALHDQAYDGVKTGYKRSRPSCFDVAALHDNVHQVLPSPRPSKLSKLASFSPSQLRLPTDNHTQPRTHGIWDTILN